MGNDEQQADRSRRHRVASSADDSEHTRAGLAGPFQFPRKPLRWIMPRATVIYSDATRRAFLKLQGVLGIGVLLVILAVVVAEYEPRPLHGGAKTLTFGLLFAAFAVALTSSVWVHKLNVSIRKDKAASVQGAESDPWRSVGTETAEETREK